MSNVILIATWRFDLDVSDTRLVLRALGGRLSGDDEIARAKELGDRLTHLRARATETLYTEMAKHVQSAGDYPP